MCSNQCLDIARIKAIFSPKVHARVELPSYLASPLVFVKYFAVCADPTADQEGVGLYRVQRPPAHSLAVGPSSFYAVVPLTDIAHAVELVPVFETAIAGIDLVTFALHRPYIICHTRGSNSQPHYNNSHYQPLHPLSYALPLA